MVTVDDISRFLDAFAPLQLAETWDNVGLLVGDRQRSVCKIMTCLTVTCATAEEAMSQQADLIVVHHPLPFKALKQLTTDTAEGRLLWSLASSGISLYSPHTAFDSGPQGINERLAGGLGLANLEPMNTRVEDVDGRRLGTGRYGELHPTLSLADLAARLKWYLKINQVQLVGDPQQHVGRVAVGCGSAGELLSEARRLECDCFVTGEVSFHTALAAEASGISMILAGHYASERFAVEWLAEILGREFPTLSVWASADERDPFVWV